MNARWHRFGDVEACGGATETRRPRLVLLLAVLGICPSVFASEWDVELGARVSETWTDNVGLAAANPQDEQITEIAPSLRLSGEGRRANLALAYRVQHLVHENDSDLDQTNHELSADGSVELARERLFLDAGATRSLDSGGPAVAAPSSNLFASDQRETVTTWRAGPRLVYQAGRFAAVQAELRREHVDFGSRAEGDSDSDIATLGISSGPLFNRWGWALDYRGREQSRDREGEFDEETTFQQLSGELSLRAGAVTDLFVVGGAEDNEFDTAEAGSSTDGDFWELGIRWNPRRTISLEAAAGERFFGDSARASLQLQGSALSLQFDLSKDLVTTPQLQFERSTVLLLDDEGNPVLGPEGEPATAVIDVPTVRDDVMIQERAGIRLSWDRSHTRATLALLATDREFQRGGTSEQAQQADLDASWTRFPRTTISGGLGYREQEFAGDPREDKTTTARFEVSRRLSSDADLEIQLEKLSRDSTAADAEYDSERITVALDMVF